MTPSDVVRRLVEIEEDAAHRLGMEVSASRPAVSALREYLVACRERGPTVEAKISLPDPMLHSAAVSQDIRDGNVVRRQ